MLRYTPPYRGGRKRCPDSDHDPKYEVDMVKIANREDLRTSLMIRNIPNKFEFQELLDLIDQGHEGTYDYFYLPIDSGNQCNMGFAFINFIHSAFILDFYHDFNGRGWQNCSNSDKICELRYGRIQGKKANIDSLKRTKVFKSADSSIKPQVFETRQVTEEEIEAAYAKYRHLVDVSASVPLSDAY
jgi:RNA recognition motif-containing protein